MLGFDVAAINFTYLKVDVLAARLVDWSAANDPLR